MADKRIDYVSVVYNEVDRPLTSYPKKLTRYLFERFNIQSGDKLLDVGCGRGEFLAGFIDQGVNGYGVDQSIAAKHYCPQAILKISDIEIDGIPYEDNFFDVVYSKSVIEHFYYPERMISEVYRVLKPGGLAIILCPDWTYNYRIYFEDYTHRTPFMSSSLRDILLIHGFDSVKVQKFRQLPILWGNYGKYLFPLAEITRLLIPSIFKSSSKWVRFSKEVMLLSASYKPHV
ncbi:class I SAM-dependent methyltransferase [Synechococcus sp. UW105]|uniref:class I SAM-dependent methyltransferase n=1 Tax=Synechococcus sp. UW105 TaxID=337067 RepID=UPI000E0E38D0|nr:class I SAM-dependent methyltransferase [Synechococcus sp. UW105]